MTKFIVIYHAPMDAMEQMGDSTPEEQAEGMKAWMTWAQQCGDKLVDMGSPLGNGIRVMPGGKSENSERGVTGYSILQAENIDEAKTLLNGHPHLGWNPECEIELHEVLPLPGS